MSAPLLEVEGLVHAWPDGGRALDGVSLRLAEGERVALLGPNGAGKSTLLLRVLDLVPAAGGGVVRVRGEPVQRRTAPAARRTLGLVFQDPDDQLFGQTVLEDALFGPRNLGLPAAEAEARARAALAAVGVAALADRAPHHLSSGEKRRAALAAVLALDPAGLLLDEPSANLDPRGRRELVRLLAGLDRALLVVTHDLALARDLCPRAVILDAGRVVADGPTAALLDDRALLERHGLA